MSRVKSSSESPFRIALVTLEVSTLWEVITLWTGRFALVLLHKSAWVSLRAASLDGRTIGRPEPCCRAPRRTSCSNRCA